MKKSKGKVIETTFHHCYREAILQDIGEAGWITPDTFPTETTISIKNSFDIYIPNDFEQCRTMNIYERTRE